ncbi:MAG: response regulator, partial [Rhodocyclaceae bacterium]|nr:response regulator [Rhodocyclaceae bacterium]
GKAFYEHMWRELLARDAWHGEIVNRRKDGSLYTAQVAITAFHGPDGQLLHYVGISSDITARKHQEAQIEDLNRTLAQRAHEAEAANRAKSAFLANMSHELRTPLHAIMGMTDLVRRAVAEPKQKGRLDKVMAASRHLLAIISDVLDISRIEAEKLSLERTAMRLEDVVQGTIALVSHRASEKGLDLTVAMPDDLAVRTLWEDPLRLGQILLNLVSNAIKFTSAGSVAVTVFQVAEEAGELVVRCEVRDTGIGIGEEDRSRLFQAFAQVDDSMTRAYGGTGLGLAISKSLAQMMGGEIGVDSRPGAGSTFWFTCRLARTESPAAASASEATMAVTDGFRDGLAGARILLVEDDPMNREVAVGFLEGLAVTVDHAADGLEAVELARRHDYDLILMDITMPRMNGIEATRVIRRLPGREDTPILAMTANAFSADRQRCLDAGMNDFLGKPVSPDLLVEAMLRWMARRQA